LLLDQIDVAVVALDPDGTITHWNANAETLLSQNALAGR
jgi:PAS domain-containing protein